MEYTFEAMTDDGQMVRDTLQAADQAEALENLRSRSFVVLRLDEAAAGGGPAHERLRLPVIRRSVSGRELVLFSRQMKMLLEAGAAVVPALKAVQENAAKEPFREVVRGLCERVEKGGSLTDALQADASGFGPVYQTMVAAGETTGSLPQAFERLSQLTVRHQQIRNTILGALLYPLAVCFLSAGVICLLLGFVVPRFEQLFLDLDARLPALTWLVLDASWLFKNYWPVLIGGALALGIGLVFLSRTEKLRQKLSVAILRVPLLGRVASRLLLATFLRVLAALLQSRVPLLEALEQSRAAVRNRAFLQLIDEVSEAVTSGGRVGKTLAASPLVDSMLAAAITTGEENGRLAEGVEFASKWAEEDNTQLISTVTRLVEPLLIAGLGVIVGTVAASLFMPMFDLASAAGH